MDADAGTAAGAPADRLSLDGTPPASDLRDSMARLSFSLSLDQMLAPEPISLKEGSRAGGASGGCSLDKGASSVALDVGALGVPLGTGSPGRLSVAGLCTCSASQAS